MCCVCDRREFEYLIDRMKVYPVLVRLISVIYVRYYSQPTKSKRNAWWCPCTVFYCNFYINSFMEWPCLVSRNRLLSPLHRCTCLSAAALFTTGPYSSNSIDQMWINHNFEYGIRLVPHRTAHRQCSTSRKPLGVCYTPSTRLKTVTYYPTPAPPTEHCPVSFLLCSIY